MDDVLLHKLLALLVIWVCITVCTAVPIKVSKAFTNLGKKGDNILSALMCFSGGVFLAAFLLHLAPEGKEVLASAWLTDSHIEYPVAELIMGAGFFLVLLVEQVVHKYVMKKHLKKHHQEKNIVLANTNSELYSNGHTNDWTDISNPNGGQNADHGIKTSHLSVQVPDTVNTNDSSSSHDDHIGHSHSAGHSHAQLHGELAARSVILLVALSMDCIFEGIACGLEDSVGDVWKMVLTIMSHEFVIAFSLGMEIVKHNSTARTIWLSFVYGLTCPLGVSIGIIITESGNENNNAVDVVTALLLCTAGGVFLYVTFYQILQGEISSDMKMYKILALAFGFILIAVLVKVVPHSHDHDHGDEHDHEHGDDPHTHAYHTHADDHTHDHEAYMFSTIMSVLLDS